MVQTDRRQVRDGLREGPGWIAFARENGTVYHTYTVMAPDPFVTPHSLIPARADAERRPQPGPHLAKGRIPRLSRSDPPGCQSEIENGAVLPCPARCPARQLKDHRSAIPRQRRSPISARDTADGGCAQSPSMLMPAAERATLPADKRLARCWLDAVHGARPSARLQAAARRTRAV